MSALEVRGVSVSLGATPILHEVDLEVDGGEALALLGPSGSGKTTLLSAVAGFVAPDGGEIAVGGRTVAAGGRSDPPERRSVGFVFRNYALWPHLTALQTVAYPLERSGMPSGEAARRAAELLEKVGIGDLGGRKPSELSGGQQQRVGVARALARRADLYLLDEPTAHLDASLRSELQDELAVRMTRDGAAALYATHDAAEALAVADRVAVMRDGRIVQLGTPADVYERPVDLWAARLTGPAWEIDGAVAGVAAGPVIVRPDWIEPGSGLSGTVVSARYRGPFTDYRVGTAAGTLEMRRPGPPEWGEGDAVEVAPTSWWAPPT